jgi:hypothetical protein
MMIEVMTSCSPAQWGLSCNRLCCAPISAPQRGNPSSPTSNARTNESRRVLESGVRGNPPAPFGRGERPQGPTYPYTVRKYQKGKSPKFFITPSKKSVKAFLRKIRKRIKESRDLTAPRVPQTAPSPRLNRLETASRKGREFGLSGMRGNSLVPFLEGLGAVTPPGYSARGRWQRHSPYPTLEEASPVWDAPGRVR